jgi:choline dehydrogenase
VIGGSSSINAMIYIRGNKLDYNNWRDEYGCDGWGYNDMLPYFIRAECNSRGSSAYHGGSGPLSVIDPKFKSATTTAFVESAVNAGATANADFNGGARTVSVSTRSRRRRKALVGSRRLSAPCREQAGT